MSTPGDEVMSALGQAAQTLSEQEKWGVSAQDQMIQQVVRGAQAAVAAFDELAGVVAALQAALVALTERVAALEAQVNPPPPAPTPEPTPTPAPDPAPQEPTP